MVSIQATLVQRSVVKVKSSCLSVFLNPSVISWKFVKLFARCVWRRRKVLEDVGCNHAWKFLLICRQLSYCCCSDSSLTLQYNLWEWERYNVSSLWWCNYWLHMQHCTHSILMKLQITLALFNCIWRDYYFHAGFHTCLSSSCMTSSCCLLIIASFLVWKTMINTQHADSMHCYGWAHVWLLITTSAMTVMDWRNYLYWKYMMEHERRCNCIPVSAIYDEIRVMELPVWMLLCLPFELLRTLGLLHECSGQK